MPTKEAQDLRTEILKIEEERRREIRDTVIETLFILGIDATTPEGILSLRKDMEYIRAWRISVEEVKRKGLLTAVGVIVTGIIAWLMVVLPWHTAQGN